MTVDPVTSAGVVSARPTGITAQLADARTQLRAATPQGSWDVVLDEVERLHSERSMPMLAALQAVYAKLAAGWIPRRD